MEKEKCELRSQCKFVSALRHKHLQQRAAQKRGKQK